MVVDMGLHSSVQAHSVCNSQREPYPRGSLIVRNVPAAVAADGRGLGGSYLSLALRSAANLKLLQKLTLFFDLIIC